MSAQEFAFPEETLAFLNGLRANNTKEWFEENRAAYESAFKQPAKVFSDIIADRLQALTGVPQKTKIFRINRDLRFSKDKTPYNAHLHLSWVAQDGGESPPAFMFGLSPDYCTVGCGVFEFSKHALEDYRRKIAGPTGLELAEVLDTLKGEGFRLSEPQLKKLPAGFPEDNPNAALALHKGIAAWRDFETPAEASRPDIVEATMQRFSTLLPLWRQLQAIGQ